MRQLLGRIPNPEWFLVRCANFDEPTTQFSIVNEYKSEVETHRVTPRITYLVILARVACEAEILVIHFRGERLLWIQPRTYHQRLRNLGTGGMYREVPRFELMRRIKVGCRCVRATVV